MRCRICLDPLNTTQYSYSVFDFITVENIRISIAGSLREIFPTLQEISKLDVPCFPTYICDSCLKFLVASYKFYIRCSKSNLKIQKVSKEHKDGEQIYFPDTQHVKYRLCCPLFNNISKLNNKFEDNETAKVLLEKEIFGEETSMNMEFTTVELKVKYSFNNEESVLNYLQLHQNELIKEIDHVSEGNQCCASYSVSLTNDQEIIPKNHEIIKDIVEINSLKKSEAELIKESIVKECGDYEDELKKILSLYNGQLPKNLQVYLEHRYSKFGFKYLCDICKLSFPEEYLLKPHIEMCHIYPNILNSSISKYQCIECGKNFKNFIALREHLKLQHIWYKCKVCQKQFLGIGKFELHVKKNHSGYRPFQCPICSKLFRTKLLFFEHEKYTHVSEKPYSCKYCNKKWTKLINLDMHMRTHIGQNSLKCQDCDDSFDNSDSLEQHRKLNHMIKKILHECDLCLAEFTNLVNLTKHMKTHKDYKPHCCVICDRRFPTLRHLKEHILVKHEKQEVLMCELCHRTYLNETDLIIHIEQHV